MKNPWSALALLFAATMAAAPDSSPATDPFEGTWVGRVIGPNASTAIGFAFTRTPRGLGARFAMPAMFVPVMELGPANIAADTYVMPDLGIKLMRVGDGMTGTFANPLLRVELKRGGELPRPIALPALPAAPPAAWTHSLGAKAWASPMAADGTLYIGTIDGKFHALRASNGSELWTWNDANPLYGDALVVGDCVCLVDEATDLVCLARADGALRWRVKLHGEKYAPVPVQRNPTFNHRTATPVVADGTLYVGSTDHGVYALDAATGKMRWRRDAGAPIYAAVALRGADLVAGCFDGTVLVLNRETGAEITRTKIVGPIASAPVIVGDMIMVGCRDYLLYGLKRADLSIGWRDTFWFSWVESVPRVVDGVAYVGGSDYRRISAIEPATGVTRWATDVRGLTWGSPVVTADTVFAGTSAQNPAAIRHEGGITALDRATGAVKWRYVTPLAADADRAGYLGSLVLADGRIVGAGYDGTLIAFPAQ